MAHPSLYSPLENRQDFRLMRIKPTNGKGIEIEFEVYRLDSDVKFTALSYVWGNPKVQYQIVCNGHNVPITSNLWEVLLQLKHQGCSSLIWADAICINQQDNIEKGIQVNMMRSIYSRAATVIFWLGKEQRYDKDAVRLMNTFFSNNQDHIDLEPFRASSLEELGLPSHDLGWIGWASLLSRPWFGRIWIVQEFLNATQSLFMSGSLIISTELLVRCAHATGVCAAIGQAVTGLGGNTSNSKGFILKPFALSVDKISRTISRDQDIRIVDLWTRSQLLGATDPRDRVFALLSTQTAVSMDIIDYNKDAEAVYVEIAKVALTMPVPETNWYRTTPCNLKPSPWGTGPQRVSRFLACKTITENSWKLPSWVPDWRPSDIRFVPLTRYFPGSAYFSHDYDHATFHGKGLLISGITVDKPRIIIDSMPYIESDRTYIVPVGLEKSEDILKWCEEMAKWQIMCYVLARGVGSFGTNTELLEALCRTMAFNALPNRSVAPVTQYIAGLRRLHYKLVNARGKLLNYSLSFPDYSPRVSKDIIYESLFFELSQGRKFCVTSKGSLAWVPRDTKLGDCICFLAGCAVPFVIRPNGESHELLGDCYLHSMMYDESITFYIKPRNFLLQ